MAQGRHAQARQQLHSLRGACGAIGATGILAEALALETALEDDNSAPTPAHDVQVQSQALALHLGQLVSAIRQRLERVDEAAHDTPLSAQDRSTQPRLEQSLDALDALLEVADFRAGAAHRAIEQPVRQVFGSAAAQGFETALQRHDYEGALRALRALRAGQSTGQ